MRCEELFFHINWWLNTTYRKNMNERAMWIVSSMISATGSVVPLHTYVHICVSWKKTNSIQLIKRVTFASNYTSTTNDSMSIFLIDIIPTRCSESHNLLKKNLQRLNGKRWISVNTICWAISNQWKHLYTLKDWKACFMNHRRKQGTRLPPHLSLIHISEPTRPY